LYAPPQYYLWELAGELPIGNWSIMAVGMLGLNVIDIVLIKDLVKSRAKLLGFAWAQSGKPAGTDQ
jgi:hypothetical protein